MPGRRPSGLGTGLHTPDLIETAGSNPSRVSLDFTVIFWIKRAHDSLLLPDKPVRALEATAGVDEDTWGRGVGGVEGGKLCDHLNKEIHFYFQLLERKKPHLCNTLCMQ